NDSDSEPTLLSPKLEFEKFVVNKFEKTSKSVSKMKKSLLRMNEKMNEIIKNYVESSISIENQLMRMMSLVKRILWKYLIRNRALGLLILSLLQFRVFGCVFIVEFCVFFCSWLYMPLIFWLI
ncbi:hypothetical protein V8G54_009141, partial [Vigna mungo]